MNQQAKKDHCIDISILIPCLNEQETIVDCIESAKKSLINTNYNFEIIVCDNASVDSSASLAKKAGAVVVTETKIGYGSALLKCINSANGKYCIMADADCSYDFNLVSNFISKLDSGCDLVVGDRFKGGIEKNAMPFLHRYIGTPFISFLGRILYKNNVRDYNCGMRGFVTQKIKDLNLTCSGMEFASELIIESAKAGYNIGQIPIPLKVSQRPTSPHLNTYSDGWRHISLLLSSRKIH